MTNLMFTAFVCLIVYAIVMTLIANPPLMLCIGAILLLLTIVSLFK